MILNSIPIKCKKCDNLIAEENSQGWYEIRHKGKMILNIFPYGAVQCTKCLTVWVLEKKENWKSNLNINYLEY